MDATPARREPSESGGWTAPKIGTGMRSACMAVGIGLLGAGLVAVFVTDNGLGTLALLAVAALLVLVGVTGEAPERLVLGGHEIRLHQRMQERRLDQVDNRVNKVDSAVSSLQERISQLFLETMADVMYRNLKKLAQPDGFGAYELSDDLKRELYHLHDHGYIHDLNIEGVPREGRQLSDWVRITDAGRAFVALRDEYIPHDMSGLQTPGTSA